MAYLPIFSSLPSDCSEFYTFSQKDLNHLDNLANLITSYFPSERSAMVAFKNFYPSGRYTHPGDSPNIGLAVSFWNPPSPNTSIISFMDSRTSSTASHSAASAVVGSRILLKRHLRCKLSLMPAKNDCYRTPFSLSLNTGGNRRGLHPLQIRYCHHHHIRSE